MIELRGPVIDDVQYFRRDRSIWKLRSRHQPDYQHLLYLAKGRAQEALTEIEREPMAVWRHALSLQLF